ncbi:MAG: Lrp/AsnC ligand binding domain-containing protein [Candidatus Thorarchaeota archaeon]
MVVKVLLVVNTEPGRQNKIHTVLKDFDEVIFACPVESGPHDIVALVEVDTLDGYRSLIEKVAALPNTVDFSSFITVDS